MVDPQQEVQALTEVRILTSVASLGVSFWDAVSGSVIADGLKVTAYQASNSVHRVRATINRRGVYVLQGLPGLWANEHGTGDADYWLSLPAPKRSFVIEVVDALWRFQPFLLTIELPVRDQLTWDCELVSLMASPPAQAKTKMVPLYSAPTRKVAGGMAVIRAELWDVQENKAAAWALLEAQVPGLPPVRSFADAAGRVALIFPYPAPEFPFGDFDAPRVPLTKQSWSVQLQAAYTTHNPVPLIPDLCATLSQPPTHLWVDRTLTQQITEVTLKFGEELIVKSGDPSLPSVLLITPAGSPP